MDFAHSPFAELRLIASFFLGGGFTVEKEGGVDSQQLKPREDINHIYSLGKRFGSLF